MSAPRVLIVKFSAIGDCVMAAHAVSMIRRTYPDAFISWAVDPRCWDVVDTDHLVNLRYEIPRERWKKESASWRDQIRHFIKLRDFKFDYGFDLQGHSKTAICLKLARPKKRIASRATDPAVRCLTAVAPGAKKRIHTVERNIEVVDQLLPIGGDSCTIMPPLQSVVDDRKVTIAVSAGHPNKQYPLERWAAVASGLLSRGFSVTFLGGRTDRAPKVAGATDLVGKLALRDTMAEVATSAVHLAADTGTGHIAAAYGIPVVSVFGYTDAVRFRPYTDRGVVLDAGKDMSGVSPERIVDAALELIR